MHPVGTRTLRRGFWAEANCGFVSVWVIFKPWEGASNQTLGNICQDFMVCFFFSVNTT